MLARELLEVIKLWNMYSWSWDFFYRNTSKWNDGIYLFEYNYNLILALLEYCYDKIPDKNGREHIIYSLHWWLQYQKFILSSLSHASYGVMFSLIRVAIENIFLSLWLGYNMWEVEPYEDKDNPLNSGIHYSTKKQDKDWKFIYSTFNYGKFIQDYCNRNNIEKSNFLKESFWYDFLCKFSHWDWIGAIFEYFKANSLIDENKVEENYKKMGTGYILFIQWAQLYSIKNLFSYTYDFNMTQENLFKNLNSTLIFLENWIWKDDKEIFKKILEDEWFRKCELNFPKSK